MSSPIEIVGLIYHSKSTESRSLPPSTFDKDYIKQLAQAYEAASFDRVLIGQTATWPDNLSVASYIAAVTKKLRFMIAQRPGFIAPATAARKLATIDHLSQGRAGVHIITAASDIETQCDGDFLTKEERYLRSHEYVQVLRKLWTSTEPVFHAGTNFTLKGADPSIKPFNGASIPVFWGGTSPNGIRLGAACADVYALGGGTIADVGVQVATIRAEAAIHGKQMRYSMSMRIVLGDTDAEAWDRAGQLLDDVIVNQKRNGPVGRVKIEDEQSGEKARKIDAMNERLDECLWMGITKATQGRTHATTLVGSPETIVRSLLKYHQVGITNFLLTGFDPIPDLTKIGAQIAPLLRDKASSVQSVH